MGLFDFFRKRRSASRSSSEPEGPSFAYVFAHQTFPWLMERHPMMFPMLCDDDPKWSTGTLERLFEHTSRVSGRPPSFRIEDVRLIRTMAAGYRCLVVVMPPPRENTDAFMIGLVHIHPPDVPVAEPIVLRNFTLEFNEIYEPPHTVMCEWTSSQQHLNYGPGPQPEPNAFVERIAQLL